MFFALQFWPPMGKRVDAGSRDAIPFEYAPGEILLVPGLPWPRKTNAANATNITACARLTVHRLNRRSMNDTQR